MLNINNIKITIQQINGDSDIVFITSVRPYKKYENGVPLDIISGYTYSVVLPYNQYEKIDVKIEQQTPYIDEKFFDNNKNISKAKLIGFSGGFYRDKFGQNKFYAKAEKLELINQ